MIRCLIVMVSSVSFLCVVVWRVLVLSVSVFGMWLYRGRLWLKIVI